MAQLDATSPVVFVCLHGAAKSVVAAAHFAKQAARRGLAVPALALGVEPDAAMSPAALAGLAADGLPAPAGQPRRATPAVMRQAARVVSFGCNLGDLVPADISVDRWDDVPAVGEDYARARDAILARLPGLLDAVGADRG